MYGTKVHEAKKNEANKKNMNDKLDPYLCCVFGTWIMSISMGHMFKQGRKMMKNEDSHEIATTKMVAM